MGRKAPGGLRSYQEESGKTPSADATEERESSTAVHLSGRESYVKRTNDDERGEEEEASGSRHPFRSFSITQTRQMVSGDITS